MKLVNAEDKQQRGPLPLRPGKQFIRDKSTFLKVSSAAVTIPCKHAGVKDVTLTDSYHELYLHSHIACVVPEWSVAIPAVGLTVLITEGYHFLLRTCFTFPTP